MRILSTRSRIETDLVGAIMQGLAADGGLYVPEELPRLDPSSVHGESLAEIATEVIAPFFSGSPLEAALPGICSDALNFPVPLRHVNNAADGLNVLELFHGPTAAFKDVGARFLAATIELALPMISDDARPLTILVATSGDTGGAVAAAFHGRRNVRVGVLYPRGQVSARQEKQLTCWGDNVRAFEIDGSFDDCQALVKQAFTDSQCLGEMRLSAANSINLGRLLPQLAYHAAAALWHWREHGRPSGFIVPTGNLGNGLACLWAQAMGMPIREVILAVNANRSIPDFLATGDWQPRDSVPTLASAMDVGNPSNMERLRSLLPDFDVLRDRVRAYPVEDARIREQIERDFRRYGEVWCPHTATGFHVYDQLSEAERQADWVVCATAHPAKFESIVEPIIGETVAIPAALAGLLDAPTHKESLAGDFGAFREALRQWPD
ncbi:MAG: threonine synthase [Gammaproteobacteria bacterium]|jgi:threonine synthase